MSTICPFTRIKTRWFYALTPYRGGEGIFSIIFPLFLFNVLKLPASTVGILLGLISCGAVVGSVFWGYVSDHYHTRRAFIVLGCTLAGVCLAGLSLLSHLIIWLVPLCFAFGFFSVAPAPIASVLIMESLPKAHWDRAFGQFNMIGGWGWIAGLVLGIGLLPALGQWLSPAQSMRLTLCGLAIMMVGTAWWALRTIPEPKHRVTRRQFVVVTQRLPTLTVERALYLPRRLLFVLQPHQLLRLRTLALSRAFLSYLVATAIMFVCFTMVMTPFPLFLQEAYNMDTALIFALTLVRVLTSAPCYTLAGRWAHRLGPYRLQSWALMGRLVTFCSLGALVWVSNVGFTLAFLVGFNIFLGISWCGIAVAGPTLVGHLSTPGHQGEAMGLYNAVQGLAQIFGAVLGGCLAYWIGYYSTFVFAGLLLIPAITLLMRIGTQEASAPVEHERDSRAVA